MLYLAIAKPDLPFQQKKKAHGRFLESGPFPKSVPTTCYWVSTDFLDYCEKLAIAGEGEEEVSLSSATKKVTFSLFFGRQTLLSTDVLARKLCKAEGRFSEMQLQQQALLSSVREEARLPFLGTLFYCCKQLLFRGANS